MNKTYRTTVSWLATVGLGGSLLGNLEGLWRNWHAPPMEPTEAVLVLAWSSLAYAIPALLLAGIMIGLARIRKLTDWPVTVIPAALIPIGVWVGVIAISSLYVKGLLSKYLLQLPASAALAVSLCHFLRMRWPASLNSARIWLILNMLTLSIVFFWLAIRYTVGAQRLMVILAATAVAICCLWGFASPLLRGKALVGACSFAVIGVALFPAWPVSRGNVIVKIGKQLNLLLITIDTFRADHLGSYGYSKGKTPNMDRMATDGVLFEDVHAPSVRTGPSHVSILTGVGPFQHGSLINGMPFRTNVVTLPEILNQHGYETAAFIGGSTLKHEASGLGSRFQTYVEDFSPWLLLPQSATKIRAIRIVRSVAKRYSFDFDRLERPAAETTEAVLKWLKRVHKRPFFLWLHYFDPHLPYAPPTPYDKLFDPNYTGTVDGNWYLLNTQGKERLISNPAELHHMIALYDGEVAYVDCQIGRLRETLVQLKLDQNTLIILTSDHGESHGEHNRYFDRDMHRPSLHVPLILNFPQGQVQSQRISDQVRLIDIMPTVLEYLHIRTDTSLAGKSLLPLIHGDGGKEERPTFALAVELNRDHRIIKRGGFAIRDKGYKLIWNSGRWDGGVQLPPWEELYNVRADPQENENIIEQQPSVLSGLRRRLTQWREQRILDSRQPTREIEEILKSLGYIK